MCVWLTPAGDTVSVSQFRDKVMVAVRGPTTRSTMKRVTDTLTEIWDLPVHPVLLYHGHCTCLHT